MDQAIAKLATAGCTNVTKVEDDDGHYEGQGVENGAVHEFHVHPHSGMATKNEKKH